VYRREMSKFGPRQEFLTNRTANDWNALKVESVNVESINESLENKEIEFKLAFVFVVIILVKLFKISQTIND